MISYSSDETYRITWLLQSELSLAILHNQRINFFTTKKGDTQKMVK